MKEVELVTLKELESITALSSGELQGKARLDDFPKPLKVTSKYKYYDKNEVIRYMQPWQTAWYKVWKYRKEGITSVRVSKFIEMQDNLKIPIGSIDRITKRQEKKAKKAKLEVERLQKKLESKHVYFFQDVLRKGGV